MTAAAPSKLFSGQLWARIIAGVWGAMIVAGFVVGMTGPESWRQSIAQDGPGCPFRSTTGIDCPFCGMTRATLAMGGGDLGRALEFHPLAPIVLIFVLALLVTVTLGRTNALLRGKRPLMLLGAIAAIWILRLVL